MSKKVLPDRELLEVFSLFFNDVPLSAEIIDTSRDEQDQRQVVIAETTTGKKRVIKLCHNDFTFPEKIKMWQRTVFEYRDTGVYCPEILCDRSGGFPFVEYKGRQCVAYAEEFIPYRIAEERGVSEYNKELYSSYRKDIWEMTARIAQKHLDYTDYPSGYCLFDTFCPSDKNDEVLDEALKWKEFADSLPERFEKQKNRIWQLWCSNRSELKKIYHTLPTSVFQADLNASNILLNDDGKFVGICDFNLCGKDVFLNYLFRENFHTDFDEEIELICNVLKISSKYYSFSQAEKDAALMLYRCIKPLWNNTDKLKNTDECSILQHLNKTEQALTANIDFVSSMA